jgi:hypothetical protein
VNICEYTNNQNESLSYKQFDIQLYNEILKSKINLIPIIKKNYNINNFKINKDYIFNENLDEKYIIPDLYQEDIEGDFKELEKTLERSIEKTFNKNYSKRNNENYLSYSDNKKEVKKGNENIIKAEGINLFNKIQQMFLDESDNESDKEEDEMNNINESDDEKNEISNINEKEEGYDDTSEKYNDNEDYIFEEEEKEILSKEESIEEQIYNENDDVEINSYEN